MSERTQFLTLQECKRVFYRTDYGVMRCHDMLANPGDFSLSPMYVMGVSIAGLPVHFHKYFLGTDETPSISQFLADFWLIEHSVGYRSLDDCPLPRTIQGKPNLLVIDRRLSACLRAEFYAWLDKESVRYEISTGKNKQFVAAIRQHQEYPHTYFTEKNYPSESTDLAEPHPLTIDLLNATVNYWTRLSTLTPKQRQLISECYLSPPSFARETPILGDVVMRQSELKVNSVNDITAR